MDKQDCIDFADANSVRYLATSGGDQQRVRAMLMWFADDEGFCFHTATTKNVCRQLMPQPDIRTV